MPQEKNLGRVGLIARFKPLHNNGAIVLTNLCQKADYVLIGIGSCNKYNCRNPFTAQESKEMLDSFLSPRFSNYDIFFIPDFGHLPQHKDGNKWKETVISTYGKLDYFLSGNDYVSHLLKSEYDIIHPSQVVSKNNGFSVTGSQVRLRIAKGLEYKHLVPKEVTTYLQKKGLIKRFRKEFGLQTIVESAQRDFFRRESFKEEYNHTLEG